MRHFDPNKLLRYVSKTRPLFADIKPIDMQAISSILSFYKPLMPSVIQNFMYDSYFEQRAELKYCAYACEWWFYEKKHGWHYYYCYQHGITIIDAEGYVIS